MLIQYNQQINLFTNNWQEEDSTEDSDKCLVVAFNNQYMYPSDILIDFYQC